MRVQRDERATRGKQLDEAQRLLEAYAADGVSSQAEADQLLWLIDQSDQSGDYAIDQQVRQVRSSLALVGLILVVVGLLSGVVLAAGVFYYDGQAPVNVVAALGVFVVLQGLMLLLAVLAALPRGRVAVLPGMDGLQEALRLASPGRLVFLVARFLPQDMREALLSAVGRSGAHQRIYARVQLWAILRWSQLYALALNLAATLTFVYLVFFSDLAFGWSTTLKIEPAQFHQAVHTIALPWSWEPTLTPSLELVERSRYFRGTPFSPEQRGAWWPFLLTAMLVYGLLPRIIAFAFSTGRLHQATRQALVATPGTLGLLVRLRTPVQPGALNDTNESSPSDRLAQATLGTCPAVVDWSRAAGTAARAESLLGFEPVTFEPVGGSRTVADDRQAIATLGRSVTDDGVALLVKLWEPPVIETTEFICELRQAVGDRVPIRVVPVASDITGRMIADDPVLIEQWKRRVSALGDPWVVVADPVGLATKKPGDADV